MQAIRASVRNGRVETDQPLDLPEGTEVLILPADQSHDPDDHWDNSPEAIAAWLKWYDSLEPLVFTAEERQAWEKDKKTRREWEFSHAEKRDLKLRGMWE